MNRSILTLLAFVLVLDPASAQTPRNYPYHELEGTVEEFRYLRDWRSYYWRDDFTMKVRDDAGVVHRVISREPTPWTGYRLGTTFTGLGVDWASQPRVKLVGVKAIDRVPEEFYDVKLDPDNTMTAFIVRVQDGNAWRDFHVNNWFHRWGGDADLKMLPHYANEDPNYTVYGYLTGIAAPFDDEGKALLKKHPDSNMFHGRVVKAKNDVGYEVKLLHLLGRDRKTARYEVFYGDPKELVPLDGKAPPAKKTPPAAKTKARFTDVTATSGLFIADNTGVGGTNPHAVAVEDFDGDGLPDVVIPTFGKPHIRSFKNLGGLKFKDVTKGSGLETFEGAGTGIAVADFDRDGKLDVYMTSLRNGASRLFKGNGDGTFTDVSEKARVLLKAPARSCAWSDVDGDGWVDLFVTSPGGRNYLFRNNRDGTFGDIAMEAGVDMPGRHCLGCVFGDYDGDGLDDLFVTCYHTQQSALFKNLGKGKFRDVSTAAGFERKASAVGCTFADLFNKNRFDLFLTTDSWLSGENATEAQLLSRKKSVEPNVLYVNDGAGKFVPDAATTLAYKSLAHDVICEDLDHDGSLDVYVGVDAQSGNKWATSKGGNPLWTRPGGTMPDGKTWQEHAKEWGIKHEANCVCVPAADFDNDGDLDLLLVNFYSNVVLFRNETNDKNWLRVKAVGTKSNPDGIGARVTVFDGDRIVGSRQVQSGAGYCRCSPLEVHFGLGTLPTGKTYRVEVRFAGPAGGRVVRENVRAGQRIVVMEK